MVSHDDRTILRSQVKSLLNQIYSKNSPYMADELTECAESLQARAKKYFGVKDIEELTSDFATFSVTSGSSSSKERIVQLSASMNMLLSFLDMKIGDPVAVELLTDTIDKARQALRDRYIPCAVLLCRVALEQSFRRLCDRHNIEYALTEGASSLAQKLREPAGPFDKTVWKTIDANITAMNVIIHPDTKGTVEQATELINWAEKIIERYIEREA